MQLNLMGLLPTANRRRDIPSAKLCSITWYLKNTGDKVSALETATTSVEMLNIVFVRYKQIVARPILKAEKKN